MLKNHLLSSAATGFHRFYIARNILGKYPRYWFSKELTANPNRNQTLDSYIKLGKFMIRARKVKHKILIVHKEREDILNKIIELAKSIWGKIVIEHIEICEQRNIGPRRSRIYTIIKT